MSKRGRIYFYTSTPSSKKRKRDKQQIYILTRISLVNVQLRRSKSWLQCSRGRVEAIVGTCWRFADRSGKHCSLWRMRGDAEREFCVFEGRRVDHVIEVRVILQKAQRAADTSPTSPDFDSTFERVKKMRRGSKPRRILHLQRPASARDQTPIWPVVRYQG